jgi:hypothetical protein
MVQEVFQQAFWTPRGIKGKRLPLTSCDTFETIQKAVTKPIIHVCMFQLQ